MLQIDTVDISLYKDYAAGNITMHEVARQFCKSGWTNYVDIDYAARKMKELRDKKQS